MSPRLRVFAVGLTLAAWASMLKDEAILRPIFALISVITLLYGVANFIMLLVSA